MIERWKQINGFSNYQISNFGNVRNIVTNHVLTPCSNENRRGYIYVSIQQNGKRKNYLLSRLVAEHFIPNPYKKTQVNHKDGDKSNNRVDNLEWCTSKENIQHAIKTGLMPSPMKMSMNSNSKLKKEDVLLVRKMAKDGIKYKDIASQFELGVSTVIHIVNGTRWSWLKEGIYHKKDVSSQEGE